LNRASEHTIAIITYNVEDFRGSERFGIKTIKPQEFLPVGGIADRVNSKVKENIVQSQREWLTKRSAV